MPRVRNPKPEPQMFGIDKTPAPRPVRGVPGGWRDWWDDPEPEIEAQRQELIRRERLAHWIARQEQSADENTRSAQSVRCP